MKIKTWKFKASWNRGTRIKENCWIKS